MTGNERTWTAYGSVIDEDVIWYTNYRGTLLCAYSLKEKRMKKVDVIPYCGNRSQLLYSNILKADRTLVLIPANAREVCLYDMETETFEKESLNIPANSTNTFCGGAVWNGAVYFFPYHYRYIVKMDLATRDSERICDLREIVRMESERAPFQYNCVQDGRKMFFMSALDNRILCFDMEEESICVKTVGEADTIFTALTLMEDGRLAAIDQRGTVYIVSGDMESWEAYDSGIGSILPQGEGKFVKSYADCICRGNKVFFFPAQGKHLLEYRDDRKTVRSVAVYEEESNYEEAKWANEIKFSLLHEWKGMICGFYTKKGMLFVFDPDNEQMHFYEADSSCGGTQAEKILKRMLEQNVVAESGHSYDSLQMFLRVIQET